VIRRHLLRVALGALASVAVSLTTVSPSSGGVGETWSPPHELFPGFGLSPLADMDAEGDTVVAFESYRPNQQGGPVPGTTRLLVAERRAGHGFGRAHQVGRTGSLTLLRLAENPAGAVAILLRADPSPCTLVGGICRSALELLYRPAGGRFGRAEKVDDNPAPFGPPALALDHRGNVTVAWENAQRRDVLAAFRASHGHFARAQRLAPDGSQDPALSVNGRGDAVAAWAQPTGRASPRGTPLFEVRAALRTAGRSHFGHSEAASAPVEISQVLAAEGPARESLVGWVAFGPPAPGPTQMTLPYLSIAFRGSAGRFGAPQLIARADTPATLAFAPSGAAVAYWDRTMCANPCPTPIDVHFIPQVSFRPRGQKFGAPADIGVQDAHAAIEPGPHGGWLAALSRMERGGPEHGILAATAPPGGPFGPTATVATEPAYGGASLATDARGDAVVAWSANGQDSRAHASIRHP
jgi:hypothetical protein